MNEKNPFALQRTETATTLVESERAVQETQAAMVIAKRFPRDQAAAMDRILQSCTRPTLAQQALYAFPRGGQMVTGPSIRLAESMAQCWGNIQFGIRELDQGDGVSTVQAFAWDIETNTKQVKEFQVRHERKARGAITRLEDPRDIYELVANQGARRMRACILSVIPGDVQEAAQAQCETTLQHLEGAPEDQIKSLAQAFEEVGVSKKQLETRLGHRLDATISAEVIQLRKIYRSIKDGMSGIEDWFGEDKSASSDVAADVMTKARERPKEKTPEWPQERDGELYDMRGIPWDERIHSAGKSCTHEGIWRKRRGISDSMIKIIEAELLGEAEDSKPDKQQATEETGREGGHVAQSGPELDEAWFNRMVAQAASVRDLDEVGEVLETANFATEIYDGILGKIQHRKKELEEPTRMSLDDEMTLEDRDLR